MSLANTMLKPSFPRVMLRLRPEGFGMAPKPLLPGIGPLRDPMADLKREIGQALTAFSAGPGLGLAPLTRPALAR